MGGLSGNISQFKATEITAIKRGEAITAPVGVWCRVCNFEAFFFLTVDNYYSSMHVLTYIFVGALKVLILI